MNPRILLLILIIFPVPAFAQLYPQKDGEITTSPICAMLTNRSNQTIMGTLMTMPQTLASGDSVRHQENFRLEAGGKKQFCTTGPFFEGQRIELVIRTLMPLFTCKTKIDRDIYLDATPQDDGFIKLTATCS